MPDEILLSESDLEKVWMDAGWNIRLEHTDLGLAWIEAKKPKAPVKQRTWPWMVLTGVALVAGVVARWLQVG